MAKSNSTYYKVSVVSPNGIRTIQGDIIEMNDSVIIARYRKSGSSKYAMTTISREDVVSYTGGVGKPSEIMFVGRKIERVLKNCVVEPSKNGLLAVTQTDTNVTYYFAPKHIEAVAEKDIDAPGANLIFKKPKMSNVGRKKGDAKSDKKKSSGKKKAAKE